MDRDILERLLNPGNDELVLSPRVIADNTDWKRGSVREHLIRLREHGLVEYYDEEGGIYQLSDLGRKWLRGDVPADEIEG
ncbi:hypothetical protein GCM10009037_19860 [Halarchaeum grantii]|uniref:Uncharacterized protein n=2 Tax=Halarchaeum grantii TaxID=1193105 RepID=A0A830F3V1_9EURY|nr:hypothetical protein GCM10009037_19860 [Halarchaeum grantii]